MLIMPSNICQSLSGHPFYFSLLQYLRTRRHDELVNSRLVKIIESYKEHSSIDDRFRESFNFFLRDNLSLIIIRNHMIKDPATLCVS